MVARYYQELQSLLTRRLKDRHAADDVVQDAYERALVLQRDGGAIVSLRAFLRRTAFHLVIDAHRHASVRDHDDLHSLAEAAHPAAPAENQPEEALASSQRMRALLATIEALPPRCREAFVLHKIEGLSQQQVAQRMGISVNMVERHIMRGMLACRLCREQQHAPATSTGDACTEAAPHSSDNVAKPLLP